MKLLNLLRLIIILLKLERPALHSLYETLYFFRPLKNEPSRTEKLTPATSKTKQQSQRGSHRNVFIHLQGVAVFIECGGWRGRSDLRLWAPKLSAGSPPGLEIAPQNRLMASGPEALRIQRQHQSLQVHWV